MHALDFIHEFPLLVDCSWFFSPDTLPIITIIYQLVKILVLSSSNTEIDVHQVFELAVVYNQSMPKDQYNLKAMSDSQLYAWLSQQSQHSDEYNAGIRETMNRIAIAEETFERKDPVHRREKIAILVAVIAIVIAITAVVVSFEAR